MQRIEFGNDRLTLGFGQQKINPHMTPTLTW